MSYNLTIWGIPNLLAGGVFLYFTYVVYKANPKKRFNQIFAISAILYTLSWDFAIALVFLSADAGTALWWRWVSLFFAIPGSLVFVWYVTAFPGEQDFWKRNRPVNIVLLSYPVLFWILLVLYPNLFYTDPRPTFYGWTFRSDILAFWVWIVSQAVAFYGIIRLIQLYKRTPFAIVRKQLLFLTVGVSQVVVWTLVYPILFSFIFPEAVTTGLVFDFNGTIFLGLAAYAILKYQLFDIEIKLKKGVEYSILLVIFFGIVLAVQQLLANYVAEILGSAIGVVVGAFIILTSFPLQRMAEDAARRVFKGASNTEAYLHWKRMEIYKAALISTFVDQEISTGERRMLEALRKKLDLSEADADHLLEDLRLEMQAAGSLSSLSPSDRVR